MVGILYKKKVYQGVSNLKSVRQLERIFKGLANSHRLNILSLLEQKPGLSVEQIAQKLSLGYMNTSDHLRKLSLGGLVTKNKKGLNVHHKLTVRTKSILVFCKKLE